MKSSSLTLFALLLLCCPSVLASTENRCLGDIPTPKGYVRVDAPKGSMAEWLRALPLKKPGTPLYYYTGGKSRLQSLNYAVIDMPLLSNSEQCADVCMRLRAEYLYSQKAYSKIHFTTAAKVPLPYVGGGVRPIFETYMKEVFNVCNTASLYKTLPSKQLSDVAPGDVFVYPARSGKKYGHAVMVVDVAINPKTGKKMVMIAEGNTPARDMHVVRGKSLSHPAWTEIDENAKNIYISIFRFEPDNLKSWEEPTITDSVKKIVADNVLSNGGNLGLGLFKGSIKNNGGRGDFQTGRITNLLDNSRVLPLLHQYTNIGICLVSGNVVLLSQQISQYLRIKLTAFYATIKKRSRLVKGEHLIEVDNLGSLCE